MKYKFETIKYDDMLPAKVDFTETESCYFNSDDHWHRELELIYIESGGLGVCKNGDVFTVKSGKVFLINSGEIHRIEALDDKQVTSRLSVHISYDYIKKYYQRLEGTYFSAERGTTAYRELTETAQKLAQAKQSESGEFTPLMLSGFISKLLYILLQSCRKEKRISLYGNCKVNFRNAKIVMEYAEEHYRENLTCADMAELVNLSPAYFSIYFKKITGTGFAAFLNNVRLKHAIRDLTENGLSVAQAAENNGFNDASSFVKICRRSYGITPLQFKKQQLCVS